MTFRMSAEAQTIRVFNYLDGSNEFIGENDAYIPPHTGLPANSTDIAPPEIPAGFAAIFDTTRNLWNLIEDHRGKTVYHTETGDAKTISKLGALPEDVTCIPPDDEYQKWSGNQWVTDDEAKRQAQISYANSKKDELLKYASVKIAILQDAVDLCIATDEEKVLLNEWKKYRVLVNRLNEDDIIQMKVPETPV
ncbi:tail fiber assembly protein [Escherichia coli]|uniref:tail fiber assembly protein n=1 Tax=Escherichia coli TaxID=562 RepID=UPI0034A35542